MKLDSVDEFIIANHSKLKQKEIAAKVGRSQGNVSLRIKKLKDLGLLGGGSCAKI